LIEQRQVTCGQTVAVIFRVNGATNIPGLILVEKRAGGFADQAISDAKRFGFQFTVIT
jgi:hypothetical protein